MRTYTSTQIFFVFMLGATLLFGAFLVSAQEPNIQFPVEELGGCENKEACFSYCNEPANFDVCIEFAEKNGLVGTENASRARTMSRAMSSENFSGPGGCTSHTACTAYCSDINNMETCLSFAERHGMLAESELAEARTMAQLMREGRTPGSCNTKAACEAYCFEGNNFEECSAFAVANGLASEDEVAIMKKVITEGGPGGCRSPKACEAYCNTPGNMEECMKFAIDNGLMPEEEINRIKQGVSQMIIGLDQMPPEARACVEKVLGPDRLEKMKQGEFLPGPAIGEKMRTCFEKFAASVQGSAEPTGAAFPPEIRACVEERLGASVVVALESGTLPANINPQEMARAVQACFMENTPAQPSQFEAPSEFPPSDRFPSNEPPFRQDSGPTTSYPPEVAACIDEIYGAGAAARFEAGAPPPPDMPEKVQACLAR